MAARSYFQIAVRHDALAKQRIIRGADRHLVEAAALLQRQAWAEQYAKKVAVAERQRERTEKRQELEDSLREAKDRTEEAQTTLRGLCGVLAVALEKESRIDWASMMQPAFAQLRPQPRPFLELPREPTPDDAGYCEGAGFVTRLIPFLAKRGEQARRQRFAVDHAQWRDRLAAVDATNLRIYEDNVKAHEDWHRRAAAHEKARVNHNEAVERAQVAYGAHQPEAVVDYCDMVLSRSAYAECFPKEFEMAYRLRGKTLVVDYRLPTPDDLPRLAEVKFVRTKGRFVETFLPNRQFAELYEEVICQVALRTLHELFEADIAGALETAVFNGVVHGTNPGTGRFEIRCIMSVRTTRVVFTNINLRSVVPRACFDSLGGVAAASPASLRAVTPLSTIDRDDDRFAAAEDVSGQSSAGYDEWNEFVSTITDPQEVRFLPLGTVASLIGFPVAEKYSPTLSKELAAAVTARGLAIEPDSRYSTDAYRAADEIALFRPLETAVTPAYPGAAVLLQLCVMIAAADEHPTEQELEVARGFIHRNTDLTSHERQRLFVLERYLCRNPKVIECSLAELVNRLDVGQRQLVGEVLVCVAGADGIITSAEWSALDRAANVLELPPTALDDILRRLGAEFDEPVVQEAEPSEPGEKLPDAPVAIAPSPPPIPSFKLDMIRVAQISHETTEVIALLSAVMREDGPAHSIGVAMPEDTTLVPIDLTETSDAPPWMATLDVKYRLIALRIVARPLWRRAEFQELAAEFKLMPLGVFDALNEWADEHLGDFLLEGDDPVTVNQSTLSSHE